MTCETFYEHHQLVEDVDQVVEDVEDVCQLVEDLCQLVEDVCQLVEDVCQLVEDVAQLVENVAQLVENVAQLVENLAQVLAKPQTNNRLSLQKQNQNKKLLLEKLSPETTGAKLWTHLGVSANDLISKHIKHFKRIKL